MSLVLRRNRIIDSPTKSQLQLLLEGAVGLLLANRLRVLLSRRQLRMLLILRHNWIIASRPKAQLQPLLGLRRRSWITVGLPIAAALEPGSVANALGLEAQLDYC